MVKSEIEKQIMRLVEKHITPKMSKRDFLRSFEGDTKTAPAKPKEKERVQTKTSIQTGP
jgi:transcriptional regulator GlxA family with amidase domain